jgi:beta-glucuronidase
MKKISLNGLWKCKPDFDDKGIIEEWYDLKYYIQTEESLLDLEISNSFNLIKNYENFEGIFWHFYFFNIDKIDFNDEDDIKIRFNGSNYHTKVWLNSTFLGEHFGGFTPFSFNVKKSLKQNNNLLVVRVNNGRGKGQIPSLSFDWFNWGGIYRNVDLLILNKDRIEDLTIKTKLFSKNKCKIEISYKIIGNPSIRWEILESDDKKIIFEGQISKFLGDSRFNLLIDNPKLWTPENPNLYRLKIYIELKKSQYKLLNDIQFGIRQIEVKGIFLYLNKKRLLLKGINLHEELIPYGRNIPYEKRKRDIEQIKSLGFNAIRTAHYSHDEDLLYIADKLGILILEEIPVYQHCDFKNPKTYEVAENLLKELIKRDINHPSVIWWSVGNEVPLHKKSCAKFIKNLMNLARSIDDTRLITCVSRKLLPDLTRKYVDIATINSYFGWYYGNEKMINLMLDIIRTPVFNKPWVYTEFGAGAKYGFHSDWKKQKKFSEERQLQIIDYTIRTINARHFFSGWFIWIYRDFKSPRRMNKYQQGFNRKGIVSGEKNEKKLIFYRIPQIIHKKRNATNNRIIGIFLWILFFPLSFLIFTRLIDLYLNYIEQKPNYLNH